MQEPPKFLTLFYRILHYFSKSLPRNFKAILLKMSMVMSSFSNDESVGPPRLLETDPTTDI